MRLCIVEYQIVVLTEEEKIGEQLGGLLTGQEGLGFGEVVFNADFMVNQ